jgi:hypothetical protein
MKERAGECRAARETAYVSLTSTPGNRPARRRRAEGHGVDVAPRLPAASLNLEIRVLGE